MPILTPKKSNFNVLLFFQDGYTYTDRWTGSVHRLIVIMHAYDVI